MAGRVGGWVRDHIDAHAQDQPGRRRRAAALQQQAGDLAPVEQHVVRPFQRHGGRRRRQRGKNLAQRDRGDEGKLRAVRRRAHIAEHEAHIEIARGRGPITSVAPPARRLNTGGVDRAVRRPRLGRGLRQVARRRDRLFVMPAIARRGVDLHDLAARAAHGRPRPAGPRCGL